MITPSLFLPRGRRKSEYPLEVIIGVFFTNILLKLKLLLHKITKDTIKTNFNINL